MEFTLGVQVQKTYLFTVWLYSQLQEKPGSNCCCCYFKFTVKTAFKGYLHARDRLQDKEAKHLGELEGTVRPAVWACQFATGKVYRE